MFKHVKETIATFFRPQVKMKRVHRVYDENGKLKEETIESNVALDMEKLDNYFKKMDEAFKKMDEAFKGL